MQYRAYGKTGKMLSALGFGAMRLPKDPDYAVEVMRRYLDLGGNIIDTARAYGDSEALVEQAVAGRRDQVYISTKNHALARWADEAYADRWQQFFDESLAALGTDHIDFYHLHDVCWDKLEVALRKPHGVLSIIQRAQDEGLIAHLCFSSHDSPANIIKIIDTGLFAGMIVQYNLFDCIPASGGHAAGISNEPAIAYAHERGLGVMTMGTVAGGRLVMAAESPQFQELMARLSAPIPDLAIRYVLANPGVTAALSGMNTIEMVEQNIASASHEQPLSADEYEQIRTVVESNRKLAELYCTGCGYCQPCPEGINIPQALAAMNYHRVWGLTDYAKRIYGGLDPKADACVECGQCEEKCPQHLPVAERLRETHQTLSE